MTTRGEWTARKGYLHFFRYATRLGFSWIAALFGRCTQDPRAGARDVGVDLDLDDRHAGTTREPVLFRGADGLGLSYGRDRRDRDMDLESNADTDRRFYSALGRALELGIRATIRAHETAGGGDISRSADIAGSGSAGGDIAGAAAK